MSRVTEEIEVDLMHGQCRSVQDCENLARIANISQP